jgi:hypothetical protein
LQIDSRFNLVSVNDEQSRVASGLKVSLKRVTYMNLYVTRGGETINHSKLAVKLSVHLISNFLPKIDAIPVGSPLQEAYG